MYLAEHQALFGAIRSGKPINNGHYMARSTMLGILGRMAGRTGQLVTWAQAMESKESLVPDRYTRDGKPPVLPDSDGKYPVAMPGVTPLA